jgi:hypothetical protein
LKAVGTELLKKRRLLFCLDLLSHHGFATQFWQFLLLGLALGLLGASFSVGMPYVARFFPKERRGSPLSTLHHMSSARGRQNDCVIDQFADCDRKAAQRHRVDRESEAAENQNGHQDRFGMAVSDTKVARFQLPPITSARDAADIMASVAEAVAPGHLMPDEATEFAKVIDAYVRAYRAGELDKRVARVEQLSDAEQQPKILPFNQQ